MSLLGLGLRLTTVDFPLANESKHYLVNILTDRKAFFKVQGPCDEYDIQSRVSPNVTADALNETTLLDGPGTQFMRMRWTVC